MEFIVNRQIAVEAETPEEALEKTKPSEGATISFNVNPRPPRPVVTSSSSQSVKS